LLMREVMSLLMSGVPTLNKPHHAGYCSLDRCSIEPNILMHSAFIGDLCCS
jgi:hypothetical protein